MIYLYKILTVLIFISVLPVLPFLYLFSKKRRASLLPRMGFFTGIAESSDHQKKRIWVHALSVGEVKSAFPVVKAIREKAKAIELVFTASTKTGYDMAVNLYSDPCNPLADQIGYFPFDLGFSIQQIVRQINPKGVVLVETDLWPGFLFEMNKKGIPVVLVNARLSNRSLKGFLRFKPFSALFFSYLTKIFVQSLEDKNRYLQLGFDESKIEVTGNIKFDQPFLPMTNEDVLDLKKQLGIKETRPVFLAGSTHEGEETILLDSLLKTGLIQKNLLTIIAPRDPLRCQMLDRDFQSRKISSVLMSQVMQGSFSGVASGLNPFVNEGDDQPQVIFVDKMGHLAKLYAICDVAFIGGSMVWQGGHNPLEAAVYSKPILFGSDMSDFLQISNLLIEKGGAKTVKSRTELTEQLKKLLEDKALQKHMGCQNYNVMMAHTGAVRKIMSQMEQLGIV